MWRAFIVCCKGQQNQRACGSEYMQSACATLDVKGTSYGGYRGRSWELNHAVV